MPRLEKIKARALPAQRGHVRKYSVMTVGSREYLTVIVDFESSGPERVRIRQDRGAQEERRPREVLGRACKAEET